MQLLQQMLQTGQLASFIDDLAEIVHEERLHEMRWDFWIHRIYDKTFDQYVKECEGQKPEAVNMNTVETTVKNSMKILENFKLN